jgi:ankyrin repeat protein
VTPLMLASKRGWVEAVRLLLEDPRCVYVCVGVGLGVGVFGGGGGGRVRICVGVGEWVWVSEWILTCLMPSINPSQHRPNRVLSTIDAEDSEGRSALIEGREQGHAAVLLELVQVMNGCMYEGMKGDRWMDLGLGLCGHPCLLR